MLSKTLTIANPSGLHLRPAGILSQCAMKFKSNVTIEYEGKKIIAKSVLWFVMARMRMQQWLL